MSLISYVRGKYFKIQETFESLFLEASSGFKDGLEGKPKADHWVRYLQRQKRESDTILSSKKMRNSEHKK